MGKRYKHIKTNYMMRKESPENQAIRKKLRDPKMRQKIMAEHENRGRPEKVIFEKRVLNNFVNNGGNLTEAVRQTGLYKQPDAKAQQLKKSASFQQLLDVAGLSDDYLNKCLFDDIEAKPGNRLGELTLAYKLRGHMQEKKDGNKTLILNISGESANRFNANIREHKDE